MIPVDFRGVTVPDREELLGFISKQGTLHDVVLASLARTPLRMVADVVIQDEYSHDVVLPWSNDIWLVYDTT
jgi:hypothetical protein